MTRGLVVGKFYPPHLGHSHLIESALAGADSVDVLVVDNPRYSIPATKRTEWLKALHPTAKFHIIDDINDDDNSRNWAKHTIELLGYAPDIVFSSEDYGDDYARYMGAKHVAVDKQRIAVPISGTKVRANTIATREFQSPLVKEALSIRVVLAGAESTGKTTLAKALAQHYQAAWVFEIGRYYTESLLPTKFKWEDSDFVEIARLQQDYESTIARKTGGLLFCDTNATSTSLWQRRYLDHISDEVAAIAAKDKVDLYIVTGDEIPFEDDGTRDGEHIRHDVHKWFIQSVKNSGVPYMIAQGSVEKRLTTAVKFIDEHLKKLSVILDTQN